ncbi:MAG TPA: serine/threonine-protein kinase [candidate division Zixibacteria bacterium]|nr:serine/threonine-protein kinase [candidate division Zixibacteria bacterium]
MAELLVGHIVGKYRIEEKLGEGGMGAVYKATDLTLDRPVALKVLLAEITEDEKLRDRLKQEARALARFNHPNIAILYEFDEVNNFLAMEFIEGQTLDQILAKEGALKAEKILDIMKQVLPALSMAHKAGITHRDIKPSNIMVTSQGSVKIMDFGIAKVAGSGAQTVSSGRIVGSYLYISPEQIEHRPVDARTDIYSLGATLYEMATGRVPFETENHFLLMKAHIEEKPPIPSDKNPDIHFGLIPIILKALEKNSEDRYQSAEEMLSTLLALPPEKKRKRKPPKPEKEGKESAARKLFAFSFKRTAAASAAVLILGAIGIFVALKVASRPEKDEKFRLIAPPGTLVLENFPSDGVLKVDGKKMDYSVEGVSLAEGKYQLSIEKEGQIIWQEGVQITSGKNQKLDVNSAGGVRAAPLNGQQGSFALNTDPAGAKVFLDGQPVAAEGAITVPPGRHSLRLAAADYRDTTIEFEISSGESKNFGTLRLPGLAQWITLKGVPKGARILLNDVQVENTGQKLEVVSGTHTVSVQVPNRTGFVQTIQVPSGKPVTVTYTLPKGDLSLRAVPKASFFIDGRPAGREGPAFDTSLESGSYKISLKHPGFGKEPLAFDTTVFIGDGSSALVRHIFRPKK